MAGLRFLAMIATWMLLGLPGLSAQPVGDALKVYSGVAVYANPEYGDLVRVEFSFSVNRNELTFFRPDGDDDNLVARVFAQIDVFGTDGRAVDSAGTYFTVSAADRRDATRNDIRVFDKLSLELAPGTYSARLTVLDATNKNRGECFFDQVVVEAPDRQKLRGTRGKVLRVERLAGKVVVEGVNRVYKHVRRSQRNPQGGRLSMEMPIDVSNVKLV